MAHYILNEIKLAFDAQYKIVIGYIILCLGLLS